MTLPRRLCKKNPIEEADNDIHASRRGKALSALIEPDLRFLF
jgi:hypothetical protein